MEIYDELIDELDLLNSIFTFFVNLDFCCPFPQKYVTLFSISDNLQLRLLFDAQCYRILCSCA
jgi:hypothetical protein